jgi:hypothetical protein
MGDNKLQYQILHLVHRFYRQIPFYQRPQIKDRPAREGQSVSDLISSLIEAERGCMITRFGSVEADALLRYIEMRSSTSRLRQVLSYVQGEIGPFWWDATIRSQLYNNAGFFPVDQDHYLARFAETYLACCAKIDILGVWNCSPHCFRLSPLHQQAITVPLRDLEPYHQPQPWTRALENRRVLVIHPFVKTIEKQYLQHERLFANPKLLPKFDLILFSAVQSIAGNQTKYSTWFDALAEMCEQIQQIDFDVAIIGAGAYGMPLAAFIKSLGKKAIHLGGATQILFGIKGARWDQRAEYSQLYNEFWVRPDSSEIPSNYQRVEEGCYW